MVSFVMDSIHIQLQGKCMVPTSHMGCLVFVHASLFMIVLGCIFVYGYFNLMSFGNRNKQQYVWFIRWSLNLVIVNHNINNNTKHAIQIKNEIKKWKIILYIFCFWFWLYFQCFCGLLNFQTCWPESCTGPLFKITYF